VKECIEIAAKDLARKIDDEITATLNAFRPGWDFDQVREHCHLVRVAGNPIETLYWDSTPLLEIHPVESALEQKGTGWVYTVTQNVRKLTG
jgi:hypothetical protein